MDWLNKVTSRKGVQRKKPSHYQDQDTFVIVISTTIEEKKWETKVGHLRHKV